MSKDVKKIDIDEQDKLEDNIYHIEGVLELLYCALSSENPLNPDKNVLTVIMDAQNRMSDIKKAFRIATAV